NHSRVFVLRVFLRCFSSKTGNYSRIGFAAAWAGDSAAGRDIYADAERRLFVADERPRAGGTRDSKTFARGRGGVRRILQNDDADVPVREADSEHDSAGPDYAAAKRFEATALSAATIPRFIER